MAKTSYVQIPSGSEEMFLKGLKSGDRFQFAKIVRNDTLLSRRRKNGLRAKSLLPTIAALWATFTDEQKNLWKTAASYSNLNGWQLFVQDQTLRIVNEMSGVSTPSIYHQSWVGNIKITDPATEIKLVQFHPAYYFVQHKVRGKKGMYEPVKVIEGFGLPLQIGLSYKSNLTVVGANPYAKFYAKIWNSYQGVDDEHELVIDLDLDSDWQTVTETLSSLRGTIIGYNLYFELHDLQGDLYFDNIKAIHNAVNWARDPICKQIATIFTAQYKQVPKNWAAEILPTGAEYDSIFIDF